MYGSSKTPTRTSASLPSGRSAFSSIVSTAPQSHVAGISNVALLEQLLEHHAVGGGLRDKAAAAVGAAAVVVEQDVRLLRTAGELLQRLDPLTQLVLLVQVVEAVCCAAAANVPGRRVPPVQADVGDGARARDDRRHDVLGIVHPRRVGYDVRHPVALEERQCLD